MENRIEEIEDLKIYQWELELACKSLVVQTNGSFLLAPVVEVNNSTICYPPQSSDEIITAKNYKWIFKTQKDLSRIINELRNEINSRKFMFYGSQILKFVSSDEKDVREL